MKKKIFLENFLSIEIKKGNFNEIAIIKKMRPIKFFCVTDKKVNFVIKNNHNLCWVGKEIHQKII